MPMATKITLQMDPTDKILLRRNLNQNGKAQQFFTHEVRRQCDPYVPMRTGVLKNTAVEHVNYIEYIQLYARRQYYEHRGNGLRGPRWDQRMWPDKGPQIVKAVANFCGGRVG